MAEAIAAASEGHALIGAADFAHRACRPGARARLFVSSDTGPLHLAAAVGTPCVALFGPMPAEPQRAVWPRACCRAKGRATGKQPQPPFGRTRFDAGHHGR